MRKSTKKKLPKAKNYFLLQKTYYGEFDCAGSYTSEAGCIAAIKKFAEQDGEGGEYIICKKEKTAKTKFQVEVK